jgi:hypothetical protein
MFRAMDGSAESQQGAVDRRIDVTEFTKALPQLAARWGIDIDPKNEDAAAKIFQRIDTNGGGHVLFIEFADWVLQQQRPLSDVVSE